MHSSTLSSPVFWYGLMAGFSLAAVLALALLALLGFLDQRAAGRQRDRRNRDPRHHADYLARCAREASFGGNLPAPPRAADAANDATLDLRDAHRGPRTARAELRTSPR